MIREVGHIYMAEGIIEKWKEWKWNAVSTEGTGEFYVTIYINLHLECVFFTFYSQIDIPEVNYQSILSFLIHNIDSMFIS